MSNRIGIFWEQGWQRPAWVSFKRQAKKKMEIALSLRGPVSCATRDVSGPRWKKMLKFYRILVYEKVWNINALTKIP